jgi:hypothetical protein
LTVQPGSLLCRVFFRVQQCSQFINTSHDLCVTTRGLPFGAQECYAGWAAVP